MACLSFVLNKLRNNDDLLIFSYKVKCVRWWLICSMVDPARLPAERKIFDQMFLYPQLFLGVENMHAHYTL